MPNFIVMLYQMGKYLNQTLIYQDNSLVVIKAKYIIL